MTTFSERMIGAARLNVATYEEVEADTGAFGQALGVVVLASLASGIGAGLRGGVLELAGQTAATFAAWFLWTGVTYLVGIKLLPTANTRTTWGELLRTTGFSASPGILRIIGVIPFLGGLTFFVTAIWMLITFVVAVRQALDYDSTWRAAGVCFIGWVIFLAISLFLF
jgi:hypothetical protein